LADALAAVNECFDCSCPKEDDDVATPSQNLVIPVNNGPNQVNGLDMTVFPNPASSSVSLQYNGFKQERVRISIFNTLGVMVHQMTVEQDGLVNLPLDLGALNIPSGHYVVMASTGEETLTRPLIVQSKQQR
jgi:hypothetical protein